MKQLKPIFTGIALAVMPTIAQAQAHIESAYKKFLKENEVAKYEFRKEQREDKTKQDFLNIYSFTLMGKQKQQIEILRKAFDSDSKAAYQLVSANKGRRHNCWKNHQLLVCSAEVSQERTNLQCV